MREWAGKRTHELYMWGCVQEHIREHACMQADMSTPMHTYAPISTGEWGEPACLDRACGLEKYPPTMLTALPPKTFTQDMTRGTPLSLVIDTDSTKIATIPWYWTDIYLYYGERKHTSDLQRWYWARRRGVRSAWAGGTALWNVSCDGLSSESGFRCACALDRKATSICRSSNNKRRPLKPRL